MSTSSFVGFTTQQPELSYLNLLTYQPTTHCYINDYIQNNYNVDLHTTESTKSDSSNHTDFAKELLARATISIISGYLKSKKSKKNQNISSDQQDLMVDIVKKSLEYAFEVSSNPAIKYTGTTIEALTIEVEKLNKKQKLDLLNLLKKVAKKVGTKYLLDSFEKPLIKEVLSSIGIKKGMTNDLAKQLPDFFQSILKGTEASIIKKIGKETREGVPKFLSSISVSILQEIVTTLQEPSTPSYQVKEAKTSQKGSPQISI